MRFIVPRKLPGARWLIALCGVTIFIWLGPEDQWTGPVTLLGTACAFLATTVWFTGRYGGRVIEGLHIPVWWGLVGTAIGMGSGLFTALLMLLKNVRHNHIAPDYPLELVGAIINRIPVWGMAGLMLGAAGGLLFLIWQEYHTSALSHSGEHVTTQEKTHLYLIRHGETDWNVERRFQGQRDTDLNTTGITQAHQTAAYLAALKEVHFAALYVSPLRRAMQTATPISEALNLPIQAADALKEINCGAWEGLNGSDIEADFPGQLGQWRANIADFRMPGGESVGDVQQRVRAFYDTMIKAHGGETIILVAHGASLLALLAHMNNWPLQETWDTMERRLKNAAITHVEYNHATGQHSLIEFNRPTETIA
ncbi:MAG: histidine phosphatase family protein [Chloroflexota bacterium]